jgi:hypothetical protein
MIKQKQYRTRKEASARVGKGSCLCSHVVSKIAEGVLYTLTVMTVKFDPRRQVMVLFFFYQDHLTFHRNYNLPLPCITVKYCETVLTMDYRYGDEKKSWGDILVSLRS